MKWIIYSLSFALTASLTAIELQMPSIFADQMVLQRKQAVPVWGTTDAGATVTVQFGNQSQQATANAQGQWRVDLESMDASAESRVLVIQAQLGNERIEHSIADVLVGEVWFAGGQSNMEWRFSQLMLSAREPHYEPIVNYLREEAETVNDRLLRQYTAARAYSIFEPKSIGSGSWRKAIPSEIKDFSGTGYFFARELRRELGIPVAIISCNYGGTRVEPWITPAGFNANPDLKTDYASQLVSYQQQIDAWDDEQEQLKYENALDAWKQAKAEGKQVSRAPRKATHPAQNKQAYSSLYNAMVHPLVPYGIKGVIWYQGESNTGYHPEQYHLRFATMIQSWRDAWVKQDLPVYWCQLANYKTVNAAPVGDEDTWAIVQDQQRRTLDVPDTGMAVLSDIGEAKDIHPRNKVDAGKRLALWALTKDYGKEQVCSGPLFKTATREGSKVVLTFDHVGSGLMVGNKHLIDPTVEVDEPLKRFQVCGSDGIWKWAEAKIHSSDTVVVSHDEISTPVEVRYAWSANPEGANLYNKEGLPASLFKTSIPKGE